MPDVKLDVKLNELRRYAILNRTPVTYLDQSGRKARVNRKGIVEIPGIAGAPPYSVEDVLAAAQEFVLEPEGLDAQIRRLNRQQLVELLTGTGPSGGQGPTPKDEEE